MISSACDGYFPHAFCTTSIHAGALFEPVTGTGRLQLGALYAAIQEDPPDYPGPGIDIPMINVTNES
jgi:hypothetical protein